LVLAFYLDQHIQKRSGGKKNLADAMVQLLDHYRKEDSDLYRNFDVWLQTISSALGKDARVLYQKHIVEGRLIPPNQFPAPPGFQLRVAAEGWPEILK
jgi:predicted metalloprotease with PDZ domain